MNAEDLGRLALDEAAAMRERLAGQPAARALRAILLKASKHDSIAFNYSWNVHVSLPVLHNTRYCAVAYLQQVIRSVVQNGRVGVPKATKPANAITTSEVPELLVSRA